MGKSLYLVVNYKAPGILRESVEWLGVTKVTTRSNLIAVVDEARSRGAWAMEIYPTKKEAEDIVTKINEVYIQDNRFGWRDKHFAEESYSDGVEISEDTCSDSCRVITVRSSRSIASGIGPILKIENNVPTKFNDVLGLTQHEIDVANAIIKKYLPRHPERFG